MLLSARLLNNVSSVNSYDSSFSTKFTEGDTVDIYLQLIDLNKDTSSNPSGRRFVPATGAALTVTVKSVDTAKTLNKVCTNPYSGDLSIWKFSLNSTDLAKGTFSLQLALTEGAVITRVRTDAALLVVPFTASYV